MSYQRKDVRNNLEPDGRWRHTASKDMAFEKRMGRSEKDLHLCDACGRPTRYIFVLDHPEFGSVNCGRTCAGKLLGKRADIKVIEKRLMDESIRREIFMDQIWRFNVEKRTWFLRYNDIAITIIRSKYGNGFGILMSDQPAVWRRNGKPIETLLAAKEAAFDIILAAERRARKKATRKGDF